MTAEVAILNRYAVALAADSYATVGRRGKEKTYNVNKLFTLSKHAPVGLMIFGHAHLVDLPWETVVKMYRRDLGAKKFDTVRDYAEDFIRYIETSPVLFSAERQRAWVLFVWRSLFGALKKSIDKRVKLHGERDKIVPSVVESITRDIIQDQFDAMSTADPRAALPTDFESKLRNEFQKDIEALRDEILAKKPLDDSQKALLVEIAFFAITRENPIPVAHSGVVIAGFGERECFPAVHSYRMHGVCCGQVIFGYSGDDSYEKSGAAVLPFAQHDVAMAFLQGIDEDNLDVLAKYFNIVVDKVIETIAEEWPEADRPAKLTKWKEAAKTSLEGMTTAFDHHLREEHIDPLLRAVSVHPKEELAVLAEALVNLTSLKRKISDDIATVGGPIDVAIITKGDGFVWIRRKYYFDPNLNPTFIQKYLNE